MNFLLEVKCENLVYPWSLNWQGNVQLWLSNFMTKKSNQSNSKHQEQRNNSGWLYNSILFLQLSKLPQESKEAVIALSRQLDDLYLKASTMNC